MSRRVEFPPVHILSLRRSEARRTLMAKELAAHSIEPRFVDAIDSRELVGDDVAPAGVTLAEWACLRTHARSWQEVGSSAGPAVILEDDVLLSPAFRDIVLALDPAVGMFDIALLGHHSARRGPTRGAALTFRSRALPAGYRLAQVAEFPMGAYAYVLTPAGAQKLLAFSEPHRMPADWVIGYAPRVGIRVHAVSPPCAVPHPSLSETTIDDRHSLQRDGPAPLRIRTAVGEGWLLLRRLGLGPTAYTWRASDAAGI